mmetsp:Transcript_6263/g.9663  ORF Transcript_6263/g.9663 Transcript_6263/m.9663 type:complete len:112 (-) Transcript_6263:53-388(-)
MTKKTAAMFKRRAVAKMAPTPIVTWLHDANTTTRQPPSTYNSVRKNKRYKQQNTKTLGSSIAFSPVSGFSIQHPIFQLFSIQQPPRVSQRPPFIIFIIAPLGAMCLALVWV